MAGLKHLFAPARIGSMALQNRIAMSALTTCYGSWEQEPTQRLIDYYEARARGGVGLITLEVCTVDIVHRYHPQSLTLSEDRFIDLHRPLVEAIHRHGAKCQPQLAHPGPESLAPFFGNGPALGPSATLSSSTGQVCRELSEQEMEHIVEQYADAAVRAQSAGYDGVELHAAHGHMLLGAFLSPLRNLRADEHNGVTPEGRLRFLASVIRRIKEKTGGDLPLTLAISGFDRIPGGRAIDDTQRMARQLVQAGVDAFRISGGTMDKLGSQVIPGAHLGSALNAGAARALKQVVDVPVITVGNIHHPELADRLIGAGMTDLVAMARPFLADPDWPRKARHGQLSAMRRCTSCQHCFESLLPGSDSDGIACAINAELGREGEALAPARRKRVAVVGAGPAGMEAARVAAGRGHRVILYERAGELGGALRLATHIDAASEPLLQFLCAQVRSLPIDIRLDTEADADAILDGQADAVIIATGARAAAPAIAGIDLPHVIVGARLQALIEGELAIPPRQRVAVIGADLVGLQIAQWLARAGHDVTLLDQERGLAPEIGDKRRHEHMLQLEARGVVINTAVSIEAITAAGVMMHTGFDARLVGADSVIVIGARTPTDTLFDDLRGRVPELHRIGDCAGGAGLIARAIKEGMLVANEL